LWLSINQNGERFVPLLKTYAAVASSVAMTVGDWIVISSLRRPVEAQSHQKVTHEMFDRWDDRIVELAPAGQG
jgi:hypothetical protein